MKLLNVIIFAETFRLMLLLLFYVVQWSPNDFIFHKNSRENTQKLVFAKVGPESAKFFSSFSLSCFCSRSLFLSLSLSQSLLLYLLFTLTSSFFLLRSLSFSYILSFSFTLSSSYFILNYLSFSYILSFSLTFPLFLLHYLPLSYFLSLSLFLSPESKWIFFNPNHFFRNFLGVFPYLTPVWVPIKPAAATHSEKWHPAAIVFS